jgi:hypothetical protein
MMDHSDALPAGPTRLLLDLGKERLDLAEVETLEFLLRADGLTAPPPWVQRRAERIARQHLPLRQRRSINWPNAARRLVAALAFDSRVQPQFVGLRAVPTHVRRLLFQAEDIEVDLEMSPGSASEQIRLAGQVTAGGADPTGGLLRLSRRSDEWLTQLDESGEFWLDSLEPGAYRLEVALRDRVIEVPVLPI